MIVNQDRMDAVHKAQHVGKKDAFSVQYLDAFARDSKRWLATPGDYYPGLYIFAGFGSRGLTSILLAAGYLVNLINQAPLSIPRLNKPFFLIMM